MFATDEWIAARTGAHRTTIARWRESRAFPSALVQLAELELYGRVELIHAAWAGFRLDARDGTLWTPENWPCRPGDVLAIKYRLAHVQELERRLARSVTPDHRPRLPVSVRQIVDVDEACVAPLAHAHAAEVQRERLADEIERLRTADA